MEKYTLAIQHTTSKECHQYLIELDSESKLYYKFFLETGDIPDGEYQYILIPNPEEWQVVFNNRSWTSKIQDVYILIAFDQILTEKTKILVIGKGDLYEPEIVASGLLRVGDYSEERTVYNKKQEYICYEA